MTDPGYRGYAAAGITALQRWYNSSTGLWNGIQWWNSANALTAVISYTKLTGDSSHAGAIGAAFDLTRESRYLAMARAIFARNTAGWDDTCRGGLWWNEAKTYKNAITNELFLTLAAQLHQRTPGDSSYLTWAQREWDWFSASGLIGTSGLVNDGLTSACQNNGETTWTYNQGVILGGLAALYEITGDRDCLTQGETIANAALAQLAQPPSLAVSAAPGVLAEPCEATAAGCDGDQAQFKGIFVRNLYAFWLQSRQPAYRAFILGNATSIWNHNQDANHQFGLRWTGPFDHADATRQTSALDALSAAAALAPS